MKINAVCLVACLLASVAPASALEQHLVDSPVLMKILKTVDEAPTDEHLLDVTLRLLKGICECMTETLLVKQERTSHAHTNAISYTTWADDGAARNSTWQELELYQKIYNNTCFNLRNELAVKVDVDELERSKNKNDTQSSFKTWNCGKQHEITTERIIMASTSMSPVLDDSLRSQLDNILFKTLIVTKDYHTYKLRRRNLFGRTIPVRRNKKKHSVIVIVTLHPPQTVPRNEKVPSENIGPLSEIDGDELDEIELNRTIYSKSAVDIDIFDTDLNPTEKESDENNKNEVSKCVLLSIYKFLTESETNNRTKVFKLIRRKKSIKIYIEIMTSHDDRNYSKVCCDGDAITTSCTQQYIAKQLVNTQVDDQNNLKRNPISQFEERNSDYKDTIVKIKKLLKLYDNELQKSTYYGKRVVVDKKLEGPKHGGHVGGDARANVIDVFAKHKSVVDHVTKSTNNVKVEFTTQIISTTAPTIPGTYTFKGFYDDELWDTIIPQETKSTGSAIHFSNDDIINEFQNPVPTKSNIYFLNIKDPSKKEYIVNAIKKEHVSPKIRNTRSTATKELQTDIAIEMKKLSDTVVNTERQTDQQTVNPYAVLPLSYNLVLGKKNNTINKTKDINLSPEYSKDNTVSKTSYQEGINWRGTIKKQYPEIMGNFEMVTEKSNKSNSIHKNNKITSLTNNNNLISKVDFKGDNGFMDSTEIITTEDNEEKAAEHDSYYLLRTIETASINPEKSKSSTYETSTKIFYNNTIHKSREDTDSNEKYKYAIINSIIESIHPQQFTDYKNVIDTTTDNIISQDSLLLKNYETSTYPPDIHVGSGSIAAMEPSAEYVEYSSESHEKHLNKSFEIHSAYDDIKPKSTNQFDSFTPLEPIIASNSFSENEYFTTDYKNLNENTTASPGKFSDQLENVNLSGKYDHLLTNSTGYSFSTHNIKGNESQHQNKVLYNAQVINNSTTKKMNPIPKVIDKNLSATETSSIINEDYVTPNINHYNNKDSLEYIGVLVTDKDNIFEENTGKTLQNYEPSSKENLDENKNTYLINDKDGTVLGSKNKIPVHLRQKGYVNTMDTATSRNKYTYILQLESFTEPSGIRENINDDVIEGTSETTSADTDKTTINSEVINREYHKITSENDDTVTSNGHIIQEKSDATTIETNDSTIAEKPETVTENIETSTNNEGMNEENLYGSTTTTLANTDSTTQRRESSSVIFIENTEKYNIEETSATINIKTPEIVGEDNQMNYSEQTTHGKMNNDFVDAVESHSFAPMSLKKVEPLVVDSQLSQEVELVSIMEKNTALVPTFPTNVQPILKNISGKPKRDLDPATEIVMVINKDDVQASEYHISTPILPLNVKPLVYTKGEHLSKLILTSTTESMTQVNSKFLMTDEKDYVNITIKNTTEDIGAIQMNASVNDELVHNKSDQISKSHKSIPTSTRIDLQVTSTNGKYIDNSASAYDQSMAENEEPDSKKTMLQDSGSKTSIEKQDIKAITTIIPFTTYASSAAGYVDYSAESAEKHVNKSFEIYSPYDDQKRLSTKVIGSQIRIEPIISNNFTDNVHFTTNHQDLKVNKTDYSVLLSKHPENIELYEENKHFLENTKAPLNISYTKNNKFHDFSENLQTTIYSATKKFATKKSKASYQDSEFYVSSPNVEPLVIPIEAKPIASTGNKLITTDKDFIEDPQTTSILLTNGENVGISKEEQVHNQLVSVSDKFIGIKEGMFPASAFQFVTLDPTLPTNVVPLFTTTTDKSGNDSISAASMNIAMNNKEQIQANNNKDSVESVTEKLAGTHTYHIPIDETSTVTTEEKELYSTLIYTKAAFLYTTTSNPIKLKATSMFTNKQTAISFNDVITKKYEAADEQLDETHTKPLNSFGDKNIHEVKLITYTTDSNKMMEHFDVIEHNSTLRSMESEMEEKLFNEIEKEESSDSDKRIKDNLNENTFYRQPETTLRNRLNDHYTATKPNLGTSIDTLSSERTILSSRDETVSVDSKKDTSVETSIMSTLPSLSEIIASTEYKITNINLKNTPSMLKHNIANEQLASRTSDTSTLVEHLLNHSEITSTHAPKNIIISQLHKTVNDTVAQNFEFYLSTQQISNNGHKDNIMDAMVKKEKPTSNNNNSIDTKEMIIPKSKQRTELKAITINEKMLTNLSTNTDNVLNVNIKRPILGTASKKQKEENNESIINQKNKKYDTELFIQNVTAHDQQLHQTPLHFYLFIKNPQNTQIKKGTNFYSEGYSHSSLMQETTTEKIALESHTTSSTSQKNSKVHITTTMKNDQYTSNVDWIEQDSRLNIEQDSSENKSEYKKIKYHEREEFNALSTLTPKVVKAGVNSELKELTTMINQKERAKLKHDTEQESTNKPEQQSKENKIEYTRFKYQEGITSNDEVTVIAEDNSPAITQNNLLKVETYFYPTTVNFDIINRVTKLAQEGNRAAPNNVIEQFSGTKEKLESKENKSKNTHLKGKEGETMYAVSTLIPVIITGGLSAIVEENLSEIGSLSSPQFSKEKPKENEMTTLINNQATVKSNIEQSSKTKLEFESKENISKHTKLNDQTDDTVQALASSTPEEINAQMNFDVNKITILSKNLEKIAVKNHFGQNSETRVDLEAKGNMFEFTDLKDKDDKNRPNFLSKITSEEIETAVKSEVSEITTTRNEILATSNDYNEQNIETNEELAVKQNIFKYTDLKYLKRKPVDEITTFSAKENTDAISAKVVKELSKIETTTNLATGTGVLNNVQITLPLTLTEDIENALSTWTPEEIESVVSYEVNEFPLINKHEPTTPKMHTKQHSVNKANLETLENKSENTENKNSAGILAGALNNLSKIEITTIAGNEGIYLPNNYKFTLPVVIKEDILNSYTSTSDEIKKGLYSKVSKIVTLRNYTEPTSPKDITENYSESKTKLKIEVNKSTTYAKLKNEDGEKRNETSVSAAKEITADILENAVKYWPNTGRDITNLPYNDLFTFPLAVTEDIINDLSALDQDANKLVGNSKVNVIKDHIEQDKTELKIQENEILEPVSLFTPDEAAEVKFEIIKKTTVIDENQQPTQQDQIEQDWIQNNANLQTKEEKFKFKNRQDERSIAISTTVAKDTTNTLTTVVEDLYKTVTSTGILSTGVHNLVILNNSDSTLPFIEREEATDIKMTSDTEHVNQGNVINENDETMKYNSHVVNSKKINDHEISSKIKHVIQDHFTVLGKIKSTLSIDVDEKERNIASFTVDYNKENNETLKNITEYVKQVIHEEKVSDVVKSHFLSDENARTSFDKLNGNNEVIPARIKEGVITMFNVDSGNSKINEMLTTGLHETLPKLIEDTNNVNIKTTTNFILTNESDSLNALSIETTVDKISVDKLSLSTKYLLPEEQNTDSSINGEVNLLSTEFTTLPKPLIKNGKMTNYTIYAPPTYDFDDKLSLSGEDKNIISKDFLKITNTSTDFDSTIKVSISALKQKKIQENDTNSTTTLKQVAESDVYINTLELPRELLFQDTYTDEIEINIGNKKPKITTLGMKYPTLIYSPQSYLDQRLITKNNNLASNHDNLVSDTNDSLQKKYSQEADEVLTELAAVLNSNCNNTNKVLPSEICYTNVLTSIAQRSKNQTHNSVIAKSRQLNISTGGTFITPPIKKTSSATPQTSPYAEKVMTKGFLNAAHSVSQVTEDKNSKTIYATETHPKKNSSVYDTHQTERSELLHLTAPNKISSLNSENTKDDDAFKKAVLIASAFKNLDFLFKKSEEGTSLQKDTKLLNAEFSPLKVQYPTPVLADKASKGSYNIAEAANNKFNSLHLNDSKIYYIPFISNAAVNKQNSETLSSNMTDYVANSMKQELALANLNTDTETYNTMHTARSLDPKDNKIQSVFVTPNSNHIQPQNNKTNENLQHPTESTQVLSTNEHKSFDVSNKNVNIKIMDNVMISKTNTSEKVTSIETKEYNSITEPVTTLLDYTFNNSIVGLTDANLLSPPRKYESMENVNDEDFQEKKDLLNNKSKNGETINHNMFQTTHSIKRYSKWSILNATERTINDSVDLLSDKYMYVDKISPSTDEVPSTVTKSKFDYSENNHAESRVINLKTSVLMNKIRKDLIKDEEFDHYRYKNKKHEGGLLNLDITRTGNESIVAKFVIPDISRKSIDQLFADTVLSKELNGAVTSSAPQSENKKKSIAPYNVSIDSFYFPASINAVHKVTKNVISVETGEPYLIKMNIKDLWNSVPGAVDTSADRDINTIQVNQSVSNVDNVNNVLYSGKSTLPAIETDVNYKSITLTTDEMKLNKPSDKQIPNNFDKYKTIKHLFTNKDIISNPSNKQITKGYVPIMTVTYPSKNTLITKPVPSIIKMSKTYKPLLRMGFNFYTTKTNSQTDDAEPGKRNDISSASFYIPNSKKYSSKSTPSLGNIEHLAPEVTNYKDVPSKTPGKEKKVLKPKSKNLNNGKSGSDHLLINPYSTKQMDKEIVKSSTTPKKQSSLIGNSKFQQSAEADDILRFFLQSTHSHLNIRPKAATERSTIESISILSNKAVMRSTKKIMRHRSTKYPKTFGSTTTAPRKTTDRKKRRRTSKRIVYNTYEPTMYEDLEIDFTDKLSKKGSQVKPTRANGEEILNELLKSSDHVHIGDATAILPWPLYFPTPSTTRQVNVRGKIELSHIVRQINHINKESVSNKSMKSVGNIDLKIKSKPTRLPVFDAIYRKHMDATEKMTVLRETYIPQFVSVIGSKPTRLINFNHYETVTKTAPTRFNNNKNEIHNNMETTPLQTKQVIYRNDPVRNVFTSTLLPPETPKSKNRNIHHSARGKTEKKLTFYQGFGQIYEKPTHFPIFGDVYKRTADTTKKVKSPTIHDNFNWAATNENNVAEDKATAFMKATRSSNMKILLFRKNDPRVSKINQFQTKKVTGEKMYSSTAKRGPLAGFAYKQLHLDKKNISKVSTGGRKNFRTNFLSSKLDSTTDTNVDFTLNDLTISNLQKSSDLIKNVINQSQKINGILLDPLDPSAKTKLYQKNNIPKYKVKKVHFNVAENNLLMMNPKELMLNNMKGMPTARKKFFDELARNNMKTYIVHSAKPSLSRQILLRPKFANIDNAVTITQVPPTEAIKKGTRSKLVASDLFEKHEPVAFNLVQNNKKQIRGLAPNQWDNNLNILEKPVYFPIMNRKDRFNSKNKYGRSTRGFLVPEEKYFLESPLESFREAAIALPPPEPTSRYQMHYVTPLKPRRSRRTIFFLSPTASYLEYF